MKTTIAFMIIALLIIVFTNARAQDDCSYENNCFQVSEYEYMIVNHKPEDCRSDETLKWMGDHWECGIPSDIEEIK